MYTINWDSDEQRDATHKALAELRRLGFFESLRNATAAQLVNNPIGDDPNLVISEFHNARGRIEVLTYMETLAPADPLVPVTMLEEEIEINAGQVKEADHV